MGGFSLSYLHFQPLACSGKCVSACVAVRLWCLVSMVYGLRGLAADFEMFALVFGFVGDRLRFSFCILLQPCCISSLLRESSGA